MGKTNVATIYGQIELDNKGFKSTLLQSKSEMARAALDMQNNSRIKIDLAEWKKLSSQLQALKGRAQEVRAALLKTAAGTDDAKKLEKELSGLTKRMSLLKAQTEPARKEMERLARAEKALGSGKPGGASAGSQITGALKDSLPGGMGATIGGLAGANPYAAAAAAAVAGITAVTAAAIASAKAVSEYGDEINDLAQSTALTTTQLQELKFVAESGGDSFESVTKSAEMLLRKLPSFIDKAGRTTGALKQLGVDATDTSGRMRAMDQIFPEVIKKLQQMTDVTARNALASQIFGRGWTGLAPILGQSNADFDAAIAKAHELGLVMSGEALAAAEQYKVQIDTLRLAYDGLVREVGSEVIPVLSQLMQLLTNNWPAVKAGINYLKLAIIAANPPIQMMVDSLKMAYDLSVRLGLLKPLKPGEAPKPNAPGEDPADMGASADEAAITKIDEMNKVLALNGDASQKAAVQYAVLNGEFAKTDSATKAQLISLAAEVDAQNAARDATKKHADEQARLSDKARQAADAMAGHQVQKLNDQVTKLKSWAQQMADSYKRFSDESVQIVKDQLQKEADARNAAADEARSKYAKLAEIGNLGARAMVGLTMFGKKAAENGQVTPGNLTNERISAAAAQVLANRSNEAAVNGRVRGALYGDSIRQYESVAKGSNGMDLFGQSIQQQMSYLQKLVDLMQKNIYAIEGINPRVKA